MKKVLITGLNGFLGNHLAKYLSSLNYEVIGLVRKKKHNTKIVRGQFEIYESNDTGIKKVFDNHEIFTIIHVATVYKSDLSATELLETNVILPIKLLEFAKCNKVKLFLNTDTFFNTGDTNYSYLWNYTLSKRHCIEWLKSLHGDCKLVNMKLHHVYGPNDSDSKFVTNIANLISNNVPSLDLTDCTQKRDFVYVLDVCNAFESVMKNSFKLNNFSQFEIGSGQATKLSDFILRIKELTNSSTFLAFGKLEQRRGEPMFNIADNSGLISLGWVPKYSLEEGLKLLLKSLK